MKINIQRISNTLANEVVVKKTNDDFLNQILLASNLKLDATAEHNCSVLLIETGGTEEKFVALLPELRNPIYLLTNGENNSLAASLEILTYLRSKHYEGEIIHGSVELIKNKLESIIKEDEIKIQNERLGVVGKPSNWLIASSVDRKRLADKFGIVLIDITMEEFQQEIEKRTYQENKYIIELKNKVFDKQVLEEALCIYGALKRFIAKYSLKGLTVRCFDLLKLYCNTSCLALAILNSEQITASCEGDTTSMVTMHLVRQCLNLPAFQANPSRIDIIKKEVVLAHCTMPLSMATDFELNTHFESDLGVAVKGQMQLGKITMLKINSTLNDIFIREGEIVENLNDPHLCRTQIKVVFKEDINQLLTAPFGNHHIIIYGHHRNVLESYFKNIIKNG